MTPRAWGWVAHLRDGGSTPWRSWAGEAEPQGSYLPGAQQLELLRRLNAEAPVSPALAARVLAASAPGRGRPELLLEGAAAPSPHGLPPVDPARLPDDELVRVAAGLLAEDLSAATVPSPPRATRRPWQRPYRLVGDPWLADPIREGLVAAARPPGGPRATVLIAGTDLATMLTHAWALRCFGPGAPPWAEWLDEALRPGRLPASVDLVRSARHWSERVGPRRLTVVLDPTAVPRLAGAPRRRARAITDRVPAVPADAAELARRVGPVLGVLVAPERRELLLRRVLLPRLAGAGPTLTVPPDRLRRVRRRAARVRDALLEGRYAVHGDPSALLPRSAAGPTGPTGPATTEPDGAAVLSLALRLLREPGPAGEGPRDRRGAPDTEGAT